MVAGRDRSMPIPRELCQNSQNRQGKDRLQMASKMILAAALSVEGLGDTDLQFGDFVKFVLLGVR